MTIELYDALISIGVGNTKAKIVTMAVNAKINQKYALHDRQLQTANDLKIGLSDLRVALNEFKIDFIKWMIIATFLSMIVFIALCKWML